MSGKKQKTIRAGGDHAPKTRMGYESSRYGRLQTKTRPCNRCAPGTKTAPADRLEFQTIMVSTTIFHGRAYMYQKAPE